MKNKIKISLILILIGISSSSLNAQKRFEDRADEDTANWRYELECVGTGKQGTTLIKVWSYSKKPQVAAEQAKKNAIHGIIFKGVPQGERGCVAQPALARNANIEQEKADYFNAFFNNGGKFQKFVSLTTNGAIAAGDRIKISRKEYKIGVIVSVNKKLLRDELEAAGIIRRLSSGF